MFVFLKKSVTAFALVLSVAGLSPTGCGQSSLTSGDQTPTVTSGSQEVSYIAFSRLAPFRAAKYNDGALPSVARIFGPAGESMDIVDEGDEGTQDDLKAEFQVFPGGLDNDVEITMTLTKGTLSQLVATFAPCGLVFNTDSELRFIVGNELVDLDLSSLIVYHIHGDGSVETAGITYEISGDYTIIHVQVPGFSRYSIDP